MLSIRDRRIERAVERPQPSPLVRAVPNRGHDEQVARAGRGDVGEPYAFCLVTGGLFVVVLDQVQRRPPTDPNRAQVAARVQVTLGVIAAEQATDVREDHDRELEPLRLVDGHQPNTFAALFEDRRFGCVGVGGGFAQQIHEAAKRQPAVGFVAARQVGDVQHVGQHLLAAAPQDEAGVRARLGDQAANRVGDRPVVARRVQLAQHVEGARNRLKPIWQILGHAVGMEAASRRVVLEQFFLSDREQRAVQRGVDG